MKCVMCGLGLTEFFTDKLIMDEDNVHPRANPTEQPQNGSDADTQRRPHTFEDAVNCLIETSQETQNQVRDMKECFETMTSQLIAAFTNRVDNNNINQ